ncbi:DUF397 domain-containing protein [Kribbella sp. NPDC059898]|uniref:DUF397 domain-containing protein n=1 Tax=Kribbella sp. NPDC059898 TaxID=3346995 RepID=UPI00364F9D86
MIGQAGLLPLDYLRHFGHGTGVRRPGAVTEQASGRGRSLHPEPARRSTRGVGSDPAGAGAVPAPGEPSGNGARTTTTTTVRAVTVVVVPEQVWLRPDGTTDANDCLEYAVLPDGGAGVRHGGQPGVVLWFTAAEWEAFEAGVRDDEFEHATMIATRPVQPGKRERESSL